MKRLVTLTLLIFYFWQLCSPGLLFAVERQRLQAQITAKTGDLRQQQQVVSDMQKDRNAIEREVRQLQVRLVGQQAQMERALKQFRERQELVIIHPELSTKVEQERYAGSKRDYDALELELANAEARLGLVDADLESARRSVALIESGLQELKDKMAELNFALFRQQMEGERTVKARGEASCGQMSISDCMRTAMEVAQRNAAESGSVVIIDSFTEIRDFQLERDDIRSRMQAIMLSHEVLDQGFIGTTGFFYEISAVVKGQIPVEFYDDFKKMARYLPVETPPPAAPVMPVPKPVIQTPLATHQLVVVTEPADALVSLVKPAMAYHPGVQLTPGTYMVEVSADGYISKQARIEIVNSDVTFAVTLDRVPPP